MDFLITTLIVSVVLCAIIIVIGKISKRKIVKENINQVTSGFDLRQMLRESIIRVAMRECDLSQEEVEKEIGSNIDKIIYNHKKNKDDHYFDCYWKPFNNIITYFSQIKSADDTWYWLSHKEMCNSFYENYDNLCIASKKKEYNKNVSELIEIYEIEENSPLAAFFLSPIEKSDFIKEYISEKFKAGEYYWGKILKDGNSYEKNKITAYFSIMEINFPHLSNSIDHFKIVHNI